MSADQFAERLRKKREERGMTQAQLGAAAGIPGSTISHFESGERKPSFENLVLLVKALSVSADYLLGTDEKKDKDFAKRAEFALAFGQAIVREDSEQPVLIVASRAVKFTDALIRELAK